MYKKSSLVVAGLAAAGIFFGACSAAKTANDANQNGAPEMGQQLGGPQGSGMPNPSGMPKREIDYAAAATKLGVTEEALKAALNTESNGRPDFAAAAKTLGVTETALQEALGMQGRPSGAPQGSGAPQAK
jgi:hypothetical protein